jgi:glucose-6-phosphate 1-dehydrogenase
MKPGPHVVVIFGGNGDLSKRKLMPALWHLYVEGLLPDEFRIIGNSRKEFSDAQFDEFTRAAIAEFGRCELTEDEYKPFAERLTYVSHEFQPGDTDALAKAVHAASEDLGGDAQRIFYLSVPPGAFPVITRALGESGLSENAKVVYEKPFGTDLKSFRELDAVVREVLDERQVFTIDHFLGKETVQNILALRFANGMFEPVWNRQHVDHVQIDIPEEIGIGTRAGFYEDTGAFRDMVVTHLFQVLAFIALEPPPAFEPKFLHDEAVKVFESMPELTADDVVFGQYESYADEEGVAGDSKTETFVAARVFIDNWRWSGVPFYLRTGKKMAQRRSSVTLAFREPPRQMFPELVELHNDHLTLELGPREGISVTFLTKAPGPKIELVPAQMSFKYEGSFGSEMIEAYERLIHDALMGDRTLFTRGDGIERVWEVVQPVLDSSPKLHTYSDDSWGPAAADDLIAPRHWHLPEKGEHEH